MYPGMPASSSRTPNCSAPSPEPWLVPPKFTRAWEPILSWNQLHKRSGQWVNGVGIDECCLMSYGLQLVHTPAHDRGDHSHVIAAPWNVPGPRSPRAHSRPTSATALCGFNEFLSHVRRSPRGGICHPAPNSAVSFYRNRWPAHSPPSLWDHYSCLLYTSPSPRD